MARVPLLAFDELGGWDPASSASPLFGLPAALTRPEVREAVFVASPSLGDRVASAASPDEGGGEERWRTPLIRYFLRMTGRPTPFGLFATCSLGAVGDRTRLVVAPPAAVRRRTRLDGGHLAALGAALADEIGVRRRMHPNPTLFRAGDRVRYVEHRADAAGEWHFHLVAAHAGDPLLRVLDAAATGATLGELAGRLVAGGHRHQDAVRFVDELADAQILVGALEPPVTGEDGLSWLLRELGEDARTGRTLAAVARALAALDDNGLGNPPNAYDEVAALLETLPTAVDRSRLFQVDAIRPAGGSREDGSTLGPEVIETIREGVAVLHRVGRPWTDRGLDRFRRAFSERFGERWVPLLAALDEESGVGYRAGGESRTEATPLLDGLTATEPSRDRHVRWHTREHRLLELLHRAWVSGADEVELGGDDVDALSVPDAAPLPDAFAALCAVAAPSDAAIGRGDFSVSIDSAVGPSGVRLVARFCDVDDAIAAAVRSHVDAEERLRPDAAFAEVVHRPQARLGNVVDRPPLRTWEIPVVGRSGAPDETVIALDDLLVTVADGRIRLRSIALDREVLPRLSNAHDYYAAGNLGLYTFLCSLQNEGPTGSYRWSWEPLEDAPFLPRVRRGRVVLSRARWRLDSDELERLFDPGDATLLHERVQLLRTRRRLPRFVHLAGKERELLADLDNPETVAAVFATVAGQASAILVEMFPGSDELVARGPEGRYVHELVVPFIRTTPGDARPLPPTSDVPLRRRDFPPGSEWLSLKIYCDRSAADRLLLGPVTDVVDACRGDGGAGRWFFVRYADPNPHLRLRFGGDPEALQTRCRSRIEAALGREVDSGRVGDLQVGVYRREVERYGGPEGVEIAEVMFHVDSEAALDLLPHLVGEAGAARRWETALAVIDDTLAAFRFDLDRRRRLVAQVRDALEREFAVGPAGRREIGDRLRPHRSRLVALLGEDRHAEEGMEVVMPILAGRSARLRPHCEALGGLAVAGSLTRPLDSIAWSIVHMSLNRVLRGAHRRQELVLTSYLDRIYDSLTARTR